jgi:antitoxin (DNA-binding transcriptional repressor) of toxin-antitoxin stability system
MTIQESEMTISSTPRSVTVTQFKSQCLDLIRQVESGGVPVDLVRRGKVVARLVPTVEATSGVPPWERLIGTGRLQAAPAESVLQAGAFDALR